MSDELRADEDIAAMLPRAWPYFFAPFGRLTGAQRAAIPAILAGEDLLVCSATASGKTEAACAPLVERNLSNRYKWMILYVSPTRALVNDLYQRLHDPLLRLGLRLDRRTGEYKPSPAIPSDVLLTTPESLDSMLCRGRIEQPIGHQLASVTAIVLDEIHLLYGTARGEQLRWLLQRLKRLREQARREHWVPHERVQIVALSATVPDPEAVVRAFLPDGRMVSVPGGREIEVVPTPESIASVEGALPAYLARTQRPEKVLVFANARKRVDELAATLRPVLAALRYETRAHHGSLDQAEREETEEIVREGDGVVVVATSTLEIGVDIGDIDLVVLDGPAPDIPALLQRIGRGNRRTKKTRVMPCSSGPIELLIHSAMTQAAREGWLGSGDEGPQHAVARQQIASYIFQAPKRARSRQKLQSLLDTCAAPVVAKSLIPAMIDAGELIEDASGVRLGGFWLDMVQRGQIHSNIENAVGSSVIEERTGNVIAHGLRAQRGRGLSAGGYLLELRKWNDFKMEVRHVSDAALASGEWSYATKPRAQGAGQPEAVRRYLGLAHDQWPILESDDTVYVFHFGGTRRQAAIELAAEAANQKLKAGTVNAWYLKLPSGPNVKPRWLTDVPASSLDIGILSKLDSLEYTLGRPSANKELPIDVRLDEIRGWLRIDVEAKSLSASVWTRPSDPELRRVLRAFVAAPIRK